MFLQMVYEEGSYQSSSLTPHLWIYRPRITVEHVSQTLQNDASECIKVPLLKSFLKKV